MSKVISTVVHKKQGESHWSDDKNGTVLFKHHNLAGANWKLPHLKSLSI